MNEKEALIVEVPRVFLHFSMVERVFCRLNWNGGLIGIS